MSPMTRNEILAQINLIRDHGYVVVAWNPDEIGDADGTELEDIVTARGNEYLDGAA